MVNLCSALRQRLSIFAAADNAGDASVASKEASDSSGNRVLGLLEARARALALGVGTRLALTSDDTYTFAAAMKVHEGKWWWRNGGGIGVK